MTERTIRCEDCGAPRTTKRKNTKYCHICRVYRNVQYWLRRTRECMICETEFSPVDRDDLLCGNCDLTSRKHYHEQNCAYCQQHTTTLHRDIAICIRCARDPENRKLLVKSLATKVNQRTRQYTKEAA